MPPFKSLWMLFACMVGLASVVEAQLQTFSFPDDIDWEDAQQVPFSLSNFFQTIDYRLAEGGIAPLDTTEIVSVPDFSGIESVDQLGFKEMEELTGFGLHVARDSVFALQSVVVDGDTLVRAGDLLIPAFGDFPKKLEQIQQLRLAGIEEVRALVNLAHAVLWPRDPAKRFRNLLRSPTIYERFLNDRQLRDNLERMIDTDPVTGFVRVDRPNRPVEKRAVVILMDLVTRHPVNLIRFYPIPQDNPQRISGYSLEVNDGISVKPGREGTELGVVTGTPYELLGTQAITREAGLPVYNMLQIDQSSSTDTVSISLDPPQYLRRFKFRSLTGVDYDVAEFEVFNYGFAPSAIYLTHPLPMDKSALPMMKSYLAGDLDTREELVQLSGGTLGRISWDEDKVGDPAKSQAVVSFQTGVTPEPLIFVRLNQNGDQVEWRPEAEVIDRREESTTFGERVNLDDPLLRAGSRDIWNVLSDEERAVQQTTFSEYVNLSPAVRTDTRAVELPREPDPVFWSGFQPVGNGRLLNLPGERPFFQLLVEFTSSDYRAATLIKNLRFEYVLPPIMSQARAEIVPAVGVEAGHDTLFTYAIRPVIDAEDAGFNRVRVITPTRSIIEKIEFGFGDDSLLERREEVAFQELANTDSFFVVGFPQVSAAVADDPPVVLIQFRTRVLNAKTTFTGHVFLDTLGARDRTDYSEDILALRENEGEAPPDTLGRILPQRILAGNVLDFTEFRGDQNSLDVVTSVALDIQDVIARLEVSPNPFTPNGDGINDALRISYDILRVVESVPVITEIYDLSGRLVRRWSKLRKVGAVSENWDGLGESGALMPPGMYLLKISAETDTEDFSATRLVALAY